MRLLSTSLVNNRFGRRSVTGGARKSRRAPHVAKRQAAALNMIWLYQRRDQQMRLETRFDNATEEFVLIRHQPDGTQSTERFRTQEEFRTRLRELCAALEAEDWSHNGPPVFMSDGWKI